MQWSITACFLPDIFSVEGAAVYDLVRAGGAPPPVISPDGGGGGADLCGSVDSSGVIP